MEIELKSIRCESTRLGDDVGSPMPWESVITVTVRSSAVFENLSSEVSGRIATAVMNQIVEEVGDREIGDLEL